LFTYCQCKNSNTSTDSTTTKSEKKLSHKEQKSQQFLKDSIYLSSFTSFEVKKVSGKHKYGGKTNIEYISLLKLLEDSKKRGIKELLTPNEIMKNLDSDKRVYGGGLVRLNIKRNTIGAANTENFMIVIRTQDDKEILREKLDRSTAQAPISDRMWWNLKSVALPNAIEFPFKVYVIDDLEDEPFEFQVNGIKG
jgi:hypothetical protein